MWNWSRARPLIAACACAVWAQPAGAQTPDTAATVPGSVQHRAGVNYHATGSDFDNTAFISRYHQPSIRATVRSQLQAMADSGASIIRTTLWQVGSTNGSWQLSFPLSAQELVNIEEYARDVGATLRPDGSHLDLHLSLAWLWCANYTIGSPETVVGDCNYTWPQFLADAKTSISSLIQRVSAVVRADGRLAVSRIYLDLEVMVGAKANQRRFLRDLYSYFLAQTSAASIEGSLGFLVVGAEAQVLDDTYVDVTYPALNGHLSLYWLYRSIAFLIEEGLPVPNSLDFSFYPITQNATYAALADRVFADLTAVFPGKRVSIIETFYFQDLPRRLELGQAAALSYLARGTPEMTVFWTTPYGGTEPDAGPPFDFSPYNLQVPPGVTASLSATPLQCVSQVCSSTVTWQANAPSATASLWIETPTSRALLACGKNGQAQATSLPISIAHVIKLYAGPLCVAGMAEPTGVTLTSTILQPAVVPEFVENGRFDAGMNGWQTFAAPDDSHIHAVVSGGVLEFYRAVPPANSSNQATVYQETGISVGAGAGLSVRFDLGNSSTARKRISVLVVEYDFSDLAVCTFWLEPMTGLRSYGMLMHTSKAWTNAAIYFYAATAGADGGAYLVDNVSLQPDAAAAANRTDCIDPAAPVPVQMPDGPDLIVNGDFSGGLAAWSLFGQIVSQLANGIFSFYRPASSPDPAGVVLQPTMAPMAAGEILTAQFDLGNSSTVRKRVTVILHDLSFNDLAACAFWLNPGEPLARYTMQAFTTRPWSNATISVYASTVGSEGWTDLDNVSLKRTPSASITGTNCLGPPAAGVAGYRVARPGPITSASVRTR